MIVNFDGVDGYIGLPDAAALRPTGAFTLELWARPTAAAITTGYTGKGCLTNFGSNRGVMIFPSSTYGWVFVIGNGFTYYFRGGGTPVADTWAHLALAWSGSQIYFVVDGAPVDTTNQWSQGTAQWEIGRRTLSSNANCWDGDVSDVRLWNIYRSAATIAAQKDARLTGAESGLVGYWRLDDGSGSSAADSKGSNDGNLYGGATWSSDAAPAGDSSLTMFPDALVLTPTLPVPQYDPHPVYPPALALTPTLPVPTA